MKLREKNQRFQSCRYCATGDSLFRVDSEEGTYYLCQKHKEEKELVKDLSVDGIEEEFGAKKGLFGRVKNFIKEG